MNINEIRGISKDDLKKFNDKNIHTTDQLWVLAYNERDSTFEALSSKLEISKSTLAALLAADACDEAYPQSSRLIVTLWNAGRRAWQRRLGHWFDLALVVVPVFLIVAVVSTLPVKWRRTVVASGKIAEGSTIKAEDVQLALRVAPPNGLSTTEQAIGRKGLRPMERDEAILADMLAPSPTEQSQVAVKATAGLRPFSVIRLEDIELRRGPFETSAFIATNDVVGRYSFESIPAGSTLHQNQLSGFKLGPAELEDRTIVSIPIKEDYFSPAFGTGSRIDLLFAPRDKTLLPPPPIADVLILNLTSRGGVWAMVVAIRSSDKQILLKWLPLAEVLASPSAHR